MTAITYLNPNFAVAPQLTAADMPALAAQGFKAIISNRLDGEQWGQLTAAEVQRLAAEAGLAFRHIPLRMPDVLTPATAAAMREAINTLPGPVLAFCKAGTRSAMAWANATCLTTPADQVVATLAGAGINVPGLADELRSRA